MRYKVSGAIAIPKASWGCAPALPNQIRVASLGIVFAIMSHKQKFSPVPVKQGKMRFFLQETMLLGKTICNIRQKGVPPLLLPVNVLQLPRCLVRICNLFHKDNRAANWKVSKSAIAAGKTSCKFYLLRKRGLLAHTSPTFLKNCWIKKLLFACGSFTDSTEKFITSSERSRPCPATAKNR